MFRKWYSPELCYCERVLFSWVFWFTSSWSEPVNSSTHAQFLPYEGYQNCQLHYEVKNPSEKILHPRTQEQTKVPTPIDRWCTSLQTYGCRLRIICLLLCLLAGIIFSGNFLQHCKPIIKGFKGIYCYWKR